MTSSAWFTLILMWSVAGFALTTFIDAAAKSEGDGGIFFHWRNGEDAFIGIFVSLVVFLFWPLVILFMLVLALRPDLDPVLKAPLVRAPQGQPRRGVRLPRLDSPFWQPAEQEAEVVSRMIRLRLKKDRRLAGEPPPWRWPMERIWASTEAQLLGLVRGYLTLREDGLAPAEIVARLEAERGAADSERLDARLRPYIKWRIAQMDPDYATLGIRVFAPALRLAIRWARGKSKPKDGLPAEWLGEEVAPEEVEPAFERLFFPAVPSPDNWRDALDGKRREWALMKLRMREGDRILHYTRPIAEDEEAPGDHGIALVRDGRAVAWVAAINAGIILEDPA
jgi:hypothetical protein